MVSFGGITSWRSVHRRFLPTIQNDLESYGPRLGKAAAVVFPLHSKNTSTNQFDGTRKQQGIIL